MSGIKTIEAPSVFLVGRQAVDEGELGRFLAQIGVPEWTTDAPSAGEKLCETAGRLCYESFRKPRPGGNEKYIAHILEVGHGSVLEAEVFNVIVTGISRSLSHELVRHRVGISPSQLSQRYVDESDVAFVVPPAYLDSVKWALRWREEHDSFLDSFDNPDDYFPGMAWLDACGTALSAYRHLVDEHSGDPAKMDTAHKKQVREAARSVLPNCTETKIFLTGNARAWRHFIELRGSGGADAEIRRLALALLPVLRKESPHVFGDYDTEFVDGVEVICTPHLKV